MVKSSASITSYLSERAVTRLEQCTERFFVWFFMFMWMQGSATFSIRVLTVAIVASLVSTLIICLVEWYAGRARARRESA